MRDWEKRAGLISLTGVGLAALGGALRITQLGLAGLAVLGAGVICWGLSGVIEGRVSFSRPGTRYSESHYGLAARAWGVLLCLAGAAMTGCGLLLLVIPDAPLAELAASPLGVSVGMVSGGLAGMLYGLTLILGGAGVGGSWLRRAASVPRRLLGVFVLLTSAALAAAGAARIATPRAWDAAVGSVSERFSHATR